MQMGDVINTQEEQSRGDRDLPEKLVFVFHELRFDEVGRACPYADAVEMADKEGEEGMVRVELDLP